MRTAPDLCVHLGGRAGCIALWTVAAGLGQRKDLVGRDFSEAPSPGGWWVILGTIGAGLPLKPRVGMGKGECGSQTTEPGSGLTGQQ